MTSIRVSKLRALIRPSATFSQREKEFPPSPPGRGTEGEGDYTARFVTIAAPKRSVEARKSKILLDISLKSATLI